ncbi:hypothetical protein ABG79_00840 [Caloramator mitchellensis]|uniref:Probable membrane transporter protein n=1 Tax=Caloramator mitchellensis TaxID=908809 RepID=A0A0R3JYX1_CALMK|nr:TSUP family transporter [Caloramator mitchellensis]KRQ87501.1 hypothetical protein ABG79_00840 [Caloramator mitchellensis]
MIIYLISLISGIISGMGIGGGTILIPGLIIFLNVKQQIAQSVNLLIFVPTGIIALYSHIKQGNIEKESLSILIIFGIIGSIIGSFIAIFINSNLLRKLFGIFLFLMGAYEIYCSIISKKNKKNSLCKDETKIP